MDIDVFTFYQINHFLLVSLLVLLCAYTLCGLIDYGFYFYHKFIKKDLEIETIKFKWRSLK